MRSFSPRRTMAWEFQGIQETPFAYSKWIERPIVAMFKHVAREQDGSEVKGFQCSYPNEIGYSAADIAAIAASPVGHNRHGMRREELDRAARLFEAVVTFKNEPAMPDRLFDAVATFNTASDEALAALMPKKQPSEVIVLVPQAQALKIA